MNPETSRRVARALFTQYALDNADAEFRHRIMDEASKARNWAQLPADIRLFVLRAERNG